MLDDIQPIAIERTDDGPRLMQDAWPRRIGIDDVALGAFDDRVVFVDGDRVTFSVRDGKATYRIVEVREVPYAFGAAHTSRVHIADLELVRRTP